jgi:hypothetical protein
MANVSTLAALGSLVDGCRFGSTSEADLRAAGFPHRNGRYVYVLTRDEVAAVKAVLADGGHYEALLIEQFSQVSDPETGEPSWRPPLVEVMECADNIDLTGRGAWRDAPVLPRRAEARMAPDQEVDDV